jgi:putative transposase
MDKMLNDLPYVLIYLYDIVIMSASFEEHLEHLQVVLQWFLVNGFTPNGAKSSFFMDKIDFLGFEVTRDGISPDLRKVQAITAIAPPTSTTAVRSFVGMIQFYWEHIHHLSHLLAPLTSLL